jgi:predicted transposase YbfD/YdcC
MKWVESIKLNFPTREIIAIDGKTLRGSTFNKKDLTSTSVSIVSAWACKSGLTLAQISTHLKKNEGEKKTMEKIIDQIDVRGNIITIDANGATPIIMSKIAEKGGDCVVGLKDNQPKAYQLATDLFSNEELQVNVKEVMKEDSGHGREEKRSYELLDLKDVTVDKFKNEIEKFKIKWPSITSLGRVVSEVFKGKEYSLNERYFLTSLSDVKEFAESSRAHWGVENSLHWQMDVTFREDYCRVRIGHAAANLGLIRRLALNLLKKEIKSKKSIRRKQLLCNFDKNYLLEIITGI